MRYYSKSINVLRRIGIKILNFWTWLLSGSVHVANNLRKENSRWGHEESQGRLFICQHVSIEARGHRDKRVRVGGNRRATREWKGDDRQEGRHEEPTGHVYGESIDPAVLQGRFHPPFLAWYQRSRDPSRYVPKYVSRPTNPELGTPKERGRAPRASLFRRRYKWRREGESLVAARVSSCCFATSLWGSINLLRDSLLKL